MACEAAMAHEANPDNNSDTADASDAPSPAGDNNESNPRDQEGDYVPDDLDSLDAIICRYMIAMYVRVLGFKEGARSLSTTTSKSPTSTASVSSTTLRSRSSAARSARRTTLSR